MRSDSGTFESVICRQAVAGPDCLNGVRIDASGNVNSLLFKVKSTLTILYTPKTKNSRFSISRWRRFSGRFHAASGFCSISRGDGLFSVSLALVGFQLYFASFAFEGGVGFDASGNVD